MLTYTTTEAKAKFAEVMAHAMAGEEIIVTRMGKAAARVLPAESKNKADKRLGFLKGKPSIASDFDELPDDVARTLGMID